MDQNSLIQSVVTVNCDLVPAATESSTVDFAFKLLKNVCNHVLSNEPNEKKAELLEVLENFVIYPDVKYLVLKSLLQLFKTAKKDLDEKVSEDFITSGYDLLTLVQLDIPGKKGGKKRKADGSSKAAKTLENDVLFKKSDGTGHLIAASCLTYEKQADLFASVWFTYLSFKLTIPIYRNVLKKMDTKIMPHFRNPLSLSDFLIASFGIGGSATLLSLSSLYILITKCNLEYPDFYKKFYNLIKPDMLYVKHRARFFYWTDIFLTSTHIPAYLVAAFAKKLARLTLTAPNDAILIILPILKNLFIRHPSLIVMINKYQTGTIDSDPYDINQEDPANANAMESSLWEVKTLLSHWDPKVVEAASFIKNPLPTTEVDLADILETSFLELQDDVYKSLNKSNFDLHINQALREPLKNFLQT